MRRLVLVFLLMVLPLLVAGWRWYMQQGVHVNAGYIKLDADQEFLDAGEHALARAAARGDTSTVRELVQNGVDVNAVGAYRRVSPLIWAVLARQLESVRTLLELGATPNYQIELLPGTTQFTQIPENDMWGESAISEAIRRNEPEILRLLLEYGGDPSIGGHGPPAIFFITQLPDGRVNPMLKLMLDHGADINRRIGINGSRTLLSEMISAGQFETAIYLLERGADVHLLLRRESIPLVEYPRKTPLTDDDYLYVNYGAWQLQRITWPDGTHGDEVSRKLRQMFVDRGVQIPFWDPDSIRNLQSPSLKELRERGTPEEVILKIIRLNKLHEAESSPKARELFGPGYGELLEQQYLEEQKNGR